MKSESPTPSLTHGLPGPTRSRGKQRLVAQAAEDHRPREPHALLTNGHASSTLASAPPESRMDRVARRAYELYERRGGTHGADLADWLDAEREIDAEDGR